MMIWGHPTLTASIMIARAPSTIQGQMSHLGCGFFTRRGGFADLPFCNGRRIRVDRFAQAHAASCPTRRKSRRDGAASVVVVHGPAPQGLSMIGHDHFR